MDVSYLFTGFDIWIKKMKSLNEISFIYLRTTSDKVQVLFTNLDKQELFECL